MLTAAETALKRVPLFAGLDHADLAKIVEVSQGRRYKRGSVVFHEGDPGDALFVLLSGRAKIVLQSEQGQEVILSVVEPPDVLGHIALLDGAPRSATVVALDALETRRLTREHFLELLGTDRTMLDSLLTHLAASLRETNEQVRTALMFDIHGQVLRALIKRSKELDDGHIIVQPRPSHQEIAEMIGKARETVSRALTELKDAEYVSVEPRAFVLKKEKLKRYWQR